LLNYCKALDTSDVKRGQNLEADAEAKESVEAEDRATRPRPGP